MSELIQRLEWSKVDQRLAAAPRGRRSDRGRARLPAAVERQMQQRLASQQRPAFSDVARELAQYCRKHGLRAPARATIYNAIARAPMPQYAWQQLPEAITAALYNLAPATEVPGDQIVFYALNYGSLSAISYAASLPWLCLQRASERSGWRPKSRALLSAIMTYRGM